MKLFTILSSILLIFFSSFLILGVISGSETSIRASTAIEAPQVVVYRVLLDFGNYHQWCSNISKSEFDIDSRSRETTYINRDKFVKINEKVQAVPSENVVLFTQADEVKSSYLENFSIEIRLSESPDGTTEVIWQARYTVRPMTSKILNSLFLKSSIKNMRRANAQSLKASIER